MFSLSSGGLWALIAVDLALDYAVPVMALAESYCSCESNRLVDWVESLWNRNACDAGSFGS